jgi:regulator of protease activity HflC (stomatin/prohibitin superfamily)
MNPTKLLSLIVGGVIGLIFALWLVFASMETVDNGNRGMVVRFGEVIEGPLQPGLQFLNPFTQDLVEMNVQTVKWDGETAAYTKDVQQAVVHFTANYNLDPAAVVDVYKEVGVDWAGKLIGQIVYEDIKREIGQHEAVDLVSQRDKATRAIEASVRDLLAKRHIILTGLQITNIDYTKEFEHAVEAKVIAQQKAIEEQNRTVQIREQAAQKVETAKGNAEATVLQAKAEAESIRIRANALEANAKLVEWEAVQKWDGKMPQMMLGSGATPFIQIPQTASR